MDDHPGKGKQMVIRVMLGRQVKEGKNSRRGRQVEGGWTISVWRSFVCVLLGVTLARKKLSCDYYWRPREKPTWKDPVLPMEWHTDDKNKWCKIKPNEPRLQNIQLRWVNAIFRGVKDSWKLHLLLIALGSPSQGALTIRLQLVSPPEFSVFFV